MKMKLIGMVPIKNSLGFIAKNTQGNLDLM